MKFTEEDIIELINHPSFNLHLLNAFRNPSFAAAAGHLLVTNRQQNLIKDGVSGMCNAAQSFDQKKVEILVAYIKDNIGDQWFKAGQVSELIRKLSYKKLHWVEIGHVLLKCCNEKILERRRGSANVHWYRLYKDV
jgi:hypothetical protein